MALEDQTFPPKPLFVLGPEFFYRGEPEPDFGFVLRFREAERLHVMWDFFYCDLESDDTKRKLQLLLDWGTPLTLGTFFPASPIDRKHFRLAQELFVLSRFLYAPALVQAYRMKGYKNLSSLSPEQVFDAMIDASVGPGTFDTYLFHQT